MLNFFSTFYYFKHGHNLPKQGNKFTDMKIVHRRVYANAVVPVAF